MKHAIGWFLIMSPLLALLAFAGKNSGWRFMFDVLKMVALIVGIMLLTCGVVLLGIHLVVN